jgi:hypothetical protein
VNGSASDLYFHIEYGMMFYDHYLEINREIFMSKQALIEGLEQLLETYSQRRRASDLLLRGLKGSHDTLNKANRALSDYAAQNTNLDHQQLEQVQQNFETIQFKDRVYDVLQLDLRRESKALANQIKALRDATSALQGEIVDLIKLDRAVQALQGSPLQDADVQAVMPDLNQAIEQAQARLGDEFGAALRDALVEIGITIGGRPPRFEASHYEILANFVNRSASISYGKTEIVPRVRLSLDTLMKTYQSAVQSIERRNEDGPRWIEHFYNAWQNAQLKSGKNSARVNIVECYYELVLLRQKRNFTSTPSKHNFVDYSRAQFAYDFYEFTHRQHLSYNGWYVAAHTASKSQTDSPSRSIWIVEGSAPHDGRFVADIVFEKE